MILELLRINRQSIDPLKDKFKGAKALKMRRVFKKIDEELETLEKFRVDLIKKYGEEKDGEIQILKESENFVKFTQEYIEAAKEDIELKVDFELTENEIEDFTLRELEFLEMLGIKIE